MKYELVSVIVPVYNVSEYLDEFLNTLCSQTYKNLEIILSEDCSTDNSLEICNDWANKDSRIKVIQSTKNGGVSNARNLALDKFSGKYVYFADPDDVLHPDLIEILVNHIVDHNADIALCHESAFKDGISLPSFTTTSDDAFTIENHAQYIEHFADAFTGPIGWTWNKLYPASLIKGLYFEPNTAYQDILFNALCSVRIKRAVWTNKRLYGYRIRSESITGAGTKDVATEAANVYIKIFEIFKSTDESFSFRYLLFALAKIARLRVQCKLNSWHKSEKHIKDLYNHYYDNYKKLFKYSSEPNKITIFCSRFLARHCFPIFYLVVKREFKHKYN
ncbi:glycosyltransferase [Butyrivibrio sp. WCE2006]|uniref:glycosyltransferase n=1 Tax=Butyrivibrio sp. WCE2006 TaxID=1410611 RepID=UPI0006789549|nr:glycosyltransferase [Butyrivibrio sp. WCE2006]